MKEALKAQYSGKQSMSVRETFDSLDADKVRPSARHPPPAARVGPRRRGGGAQSGYLDRAELDAAAGLLGGGLGFLMSVDDLDKVRPPRPCLPPSAPRRGPFRPR
jgi:hypothetical protein